MGPPRFHYATLIPCVLIKVFKQMNYASISTYIINTKMLWIGQRASIPHTKTNSDLSI